jgi:hypothetical protein
MRNSTGTFPRYTWWKKNEHSVPTVSMPILRMKDFVRPKPFLLFVAVAALLLLFPGFACPFPNEPDGYEGIPWGTSIEVLPDMISLGASPKREGGRLYSRPGDILRFGRADLKSVEYEFVKEQFAGVIIKVSDLLNYVRLKEEVFRRFGKGTDLDKNAERFFWDGKSTRITLISAFDLS